MKTERARGSALINSLPVVMVLCLLGCTYESAAQQMLTQTLPVILAQSPRSALANAATNQLAIVHEQLLGTIVGAEGHATYCRNSCRAAIIVSNNGKKSLFVDGNYGHVYDDIEDTAVGTYPIFSDDGQHVAYVAKKGAFWCVVEDEHEGPMCDDVSRIIFSPDSKRFAYCASNKGKYQAIVDGQAGAQYLGIKDVTFSPDSKIFAYLALNTKHQFKIILNNQEMPFETEAYGLDGARIKFCFSPNSKRFAYFCKEGDQWAVFEDGHAGPSFNHIGYGKLCFSPDSKHLAYPVENDGKTMIIADDVISPSWDEVEYFKSPFSQNGEHLSYQAKTGDWWMAIIDGKEAGIKYSRTAYGPGVLFSPNGKHYAYIMPYFEHSFLMVDGKTWGPFKSVLGDCFCFSENSEHLAYVAMDDNRKRDVIIDGVMIHPTKSSRIGPIIFSPDSRQLAYVLFENDSYYAVVHHLSPPLFDSTDGWNETVGPPYDHPPHASMFLPDGSLQYIAERNHTLYRVTQINSY